jgi:hypothetical protein
MQQRRHTDLPPSGAGAPAALASRDDHEATADARKLGRVYGFIVDALARKDLEAEEDDSRAESSCSA